MSCNSSLKYIGNRWQRIFAKKKKKKRRKAWTRKQLCQRVESESDGSNDKGFFTSAVELSATGLDQLIIILVRHYNYHIVMCFAIDFLIYNCCFR